MKKVEMIDAIVAGQPAEEAVKIREQLESQTWDEVLAIYRVEQAGGTENAPAAPAAKTSSGDRVTDEGLWLAISTLTELEKTVGKNYKHALAMAIKKLQDLL